MSALTPKADIVCDKVRIMKPVTIASVRAHGVRQLLVYCNGKREGAWPGSADRAGSGLGSFPPSRDPAHCPASGIRSVAGQGVRPTSHWSERGLSILSRFTSTSLMARSTSLSLRVLRIFFVPGTTGSCAAMSLRNFLRSLRGTKPATSWTVFTVGRRENAASSPRRLAIPRL